MRRQPASIDGLPQGPGSRILRAADADAWQLGFSFCVQARQRAAEIEHAARQAYDAERARGYADGKAEAAREATTRIAETSLAVDRYLAGMEGHVARLAIGIVRRLLGELDAADVVGRIVAGAIADFRREKWLKIKVHPTVVEQVRASIERSAGEPSPAVTVEADARLSTDACVVASEFAVVDAGVEAQLAAIAAAFGVQPESTGR